MEPGQGQGLSLRDLGEMGGSQTVTLIQSEMPAHTHTMQASNAPGEQSSPANNILARSDNGSIYADPGNTNTVQLKETMLAPSGGSLPHNNMSPFLTLNFCIAMQGVFPPRG